MRSIAPAFLLSFLASGALANSGGEWVNLPSLNQARQETGAALLDDRIYVVGGLVPGAGVVATATVERYDASDDAWSFVAPLPAARDHMAAVAVPAFGPQRAGPALGPRLFVIGGYAGDFIARSTAWAYDVDANAWSPIAPLPQTRGACWAVEHGGRIYLFGGRDASGVTRRTTFIYEPSLNVWATGADMPTAREHLNAVAVGEYIYVIGGRNGPANNLNERYHPATDSWEVMTPMPTARSAAAVAAVGPLIIVAGGEVPVLQSVNEAYDVRTDSWTCFDPMPIPRHGVAAVSRAGMVVMPGGGTIQGLAPTAAVDAFTPPEQCPDLDGDGAAGSTDLALLLGSWGQNGGAADLDFNGAVNAADLALLLGAWGECP